LGTPPALSILRPVFLFLGCLHLAIGPTSCLQIFAWANMLVDYSEGRSLTEAAAMTFNGEHPCDLCCALSEKRAKEKEEPASQPERQPQQHLFPLEDVQPRKGRTLTKSSNPRAPTLLLADCRFFAKPTTPPPWS
jgi:hypothetical protein